MFVLIIDDSKVFRKRLIEMLTVNMKSNIYLEANNIHEAKDILHNFSPDIVITDIRMPGGSGIDLIRKTRANDRITKIIAITNYAEDQYRTEALKAGADYFFCKSNDLESLLNLIDSLSPKTTKVKILKTNK
jgi:DNA-binding NarL/FixJ family response regulator